MTLSVYEKFMRAIANDDCAAVMKHWPSPKLTESDRQWGFKEAVHFNQHVMVQYMLDNCLDAESLLVNEYGNCLKWLATKNTPSQLIEFDALTHLLISYTDRLNEQHQYETFELFVACQHRRGAAQMTDVVGPTKIYEWLQANPTWNKLLPEVMQNITLQHSVGEVSWLPQPSTRKI